MEVAQPHIPKWVPNQGGVAQQVPAPQASSTLLGEGVVRSCPIVPQRLFSGASPMPAALVASARAFIGSNGKASWTVASRFDATAREAVGPDASTSDASGAPAGN